MLYTINNQLTYDRYDDGDVIVQDLLKNKHYLINATCWQIIQLFNKPISKSDALKSFLSMYKDNDKTIQEDFNKTFLVLIKNNIIREVV